MAKENGQYILIGELTKGKAVSDTLDVQLFERISYFREWIDSQMINPEFCPSGPNAGASRSEDMVKKNEEDTTNVWILMCQTLGNIILLNYVKDLFYIIKLMVLDMKNQDQRILEIFTEISLLDTSNRIQS